MALETWDEDVAEAVAVVAEAEGVVTTTKTTVNTTTTKIAEVVRIRLEQHHLGTQ